MGKRKITASDLDRMNSTKPDETKNRGGRPPFAPTNEQRAQVKALAMFGSPQYQIAEHLDVDEGTLIKHFATELREAKPHLHARATSVIFNALSSPKEEIRVRTAMYVLDRQGRELGWNDRVDTWLEHTLLRGIELRKLTREELNELGQLLVKAGANLDLPPPPPSRAPGVLPVSAPQLPPKPH
jgi:hypothetical protein